MATEERGRLKDLLYADNEVLNNWITKLSIGFLSKKRNGPLQLIIQHELCKMYLKFLPQSFQKWLLWHTDLVRRLKQKSMLTQIWVYWCTIFSVPLLWKYENIKASMNSYEEETCLTLFMWVFLKFSWPLVPLWMPHY